MSQQLHVLQCYNCKAFQVDIVKKVPKWTCKICTEKQSVKKIYGVGTGKVCRLLVQSLNERRVSKLQCQQNSDQFLKTQTCCETINNSVKDRSLCDGIDLQHENEEQVKKSKWSEFTEISNEQMIFSKYLNVNDTGKIEKKECDSIFEDENQEIDALLTF